MAETIPRENWSEAEAYQARLVYWDYLVDHWLVPGPAVLRQESEDELAGPARPFNRHEYGWILERDTLLEQ